MKPKTLYDFTPRQRQILLILARMDGAREKAIAEELGVAPGTMKTYLNAIMTRAGDDLPGRNRTALSALAARLVAEDRARDVFLRSRAVKGISVRECMDARAAHGGESNG